MTATLMQAGVVAATIAQAGAIGNQGGGGGGGGGGGVVK